MTASGTAFNNSSSITTFIGGDKPFISINTYSHLGSASNSTWGYLSAPQYGTQYTNTIPNNYSASNSPAINKSLLAGRFGLTDVCGNSNSAVLIQYQNAVSGTTAGLTSFCRRTGTNAPDNGGAQVQQLQEYILYFNLSQSNSNIVNIQTEENAYFNLY
jgi:hypothetical protein